MLKRLLLFALFIVSAHGSLVADQLPVGAGVGIVRGSVGVIISTAEGFVLATDSRLTIKTDSGTRHNDDAQKLFLVGTRTACVVAGLQGSKVGSGALRPADAIGTTLLALDRLAFTNRITAENIVASFYFAMKRIGELGNWPRNETPQVGELSVVSINPDETSDWISLSVPLTATGNNAGGPLSVGTPTYNIRATGTRLHFACDVIGQHAIANQLLQASRPGRDKHGRSPIMKRYYRSKRSGQLERFTLADAIMFAHELVQATIDLAPESDGVGGPIDIATVTGAGVHWIQRKSATAPVPSPHVFVTNSAFSSSPQILDNLQCIHCDFTDTHLLFTGNGDVQLDDCKFGGACRLVITPEAKRRTPDTVEALQQLIGDKCGQVIQESNYP